MAKQRLCIDTKTNRKRWVRSDTPIVEFLGPYRGTLGRAPGEILAFVYPKRGHPFTAAIQYETRSSK